MGHSTPPLANAESLPEILTAKELEAFLQISVKTIYAYVQHGLIPYIRIESNVRSSKHQILEWLRQRTFEPRPVNGKGAKRQ
jgi:predicted DNA-binding transcriptional regulator AlpA